MPPTARTWGYLAAGTAAAIAAYRLTVWYQKRRDLEDGLRKLEEDMLIPKDQLLAIRDDMVEQMAQGLAGGGSTLLMLPTMVDFLPSGDEQGQFLAIDIGGSNFRVTCVRLAAQKSAVADIKVAEQPIPEDCRRCHQQKLFDWIATTVTKFVADNGIDFGEDVPVVGFCFSFPVHQDAVGSGTIVKWTKGYEVSGAEGKNLVQLLEDALLRAQLPAKVAVLINDTVGCLAAARYADEDTEAGVVLGTGFNVCYVEQVDRIKTLPAGYSPHSSVMAVNTECADYHSPLLPRLDEDVWLDAASNTPGQAVLEKMMSGLYMGEIARRIILRLAEDHALLGSGPIPKGLIFHFNALTTPAMAAIHDDDSPDLAVVAATLEEKLGIPAATLSLPTRKIVQRVCALVAMRSARLLATTIAAVLKQTGRDAPGGPVTAVAVDGGVYEKYNGFRAAVQEALQAVLGRELAARVRLRTSSNGSSLGAAKLAAAAAAQLPEAQPSAGLRALSIKRQLGRDV